MKKYYVYRCHPTDTNPDISYMKDWWDRDITSSMDFEDAMIFNTEEGAIFSAKFWKREASLPGYNYIVGALNIEVDEFWVGKNVQ